jgi:hypothetical protein
MSTPHFSQDRIDWTNFCLARLDYVTALAKVVEQSFLRRDTTHPVFCGCIDWHSSVHGANALLTAARLTGHTPWEAVVDAALNPERLAFERAALQAGDLDHEMPYGYAWFLALAQEREQMWGKQDLLSLATDIASRLAQWMLALSDEAVVHHVQRREYGNLSWAVLNVWRWGKWKQDLTLMESLADFTRIRLLPLDRECSSAFDQFTDEFFSPTLQRCRALLEILPPEESLKWLGSQLPGIGRLSPLTCFPTTHSAGLNFSRSWGLWTLFQHTQDLKFRDLYIDHVVSHMNLPHYWRNDYRKHAHWVPQFGIYAIALSIEGGSIRVERS